MAVSMFCQHYSISIIGKSFCLKSFIKNAITAIVRQRLKSVFFLPMLIVLIISFSGCAIIALPVYYPDDDPFPEEKYSFITPGITTKASVVEKMGNPTAYRLGEKIYIYAQGKKNWRWVGMWAVYGGHGGFFNIPTYLTHLLIINFDKDDVVSTFEEFTGDSGELKSGFFVVNSGGYIIGSGEYKKWYFADFRLILNATQDLDKQVKELNVNPNKSVIFFYKNVSNDSEVYLDNNKSVNCGSDGFLVWVVEPGEHTINSDNEMYPLTIQCHPGEVYYVEHREGMITEKEQVIANNEISKRKLTIDRFDIFDFNSK